MRTIAERRHLTRRKVEQRKDLLKSYGGYDYKLEAGDNRLAVRHPFDCGSRCFMCHGDKLLGIRTRAERELTVERNIADWIGDWNV